MSLFHISCISLTSHTHVYLRHHHHPTLPPSSSVYTYSSYTLHALHTHHTLPPSSPVSKYSSYSPSILPSLQVFIILSLHPPQSPSIHHTLPPSSPVSKYSSYSPSIHQVFIILSVHPPPSVSVHIFNFIHHCSRGHIQSVQPLLS